MKRFLLAIVILFCCSAYRMDAQFMDSTKGLLCMPSAEFEEDATFMITNTWMRRPYLPKGETYGWNDHDTFSYGFDVTLWGRLEIAYICVLNDSWKYRPGVHMINQDRHFAARGLLLKEGDFGQMWMPNLALGFSDPTTGHGDYLDGNIGSSGNGFFNKFYVALSKSFKTGWGTVGGHLAYQYSLRRDGIPTGVCAGVTWEPKWLNNPEWFMNNFRATLEWDGRAVNFGINTSIWKNRFELMAMLFNMQTIMVGARFKLVLKH